MDFLNAFLAYVVGLVGPGYVVARLLRSPAPWACSIPVSMVMLLAVVLLVDAVGLPVALSSVLLIELPIVGVLGVALWRAERRRDCRGESIAGDVAAAGVRDPGGRLEARLLVAGLGVVGLAAIVRGLLAPMSGGDASFRWEFLATRIVAEKSLGFYPPVSAEDFRVYFHVDGFPPLVSVAYWWIYAWIGRVVPEAVMPLVAAQYLATVAFTYRTAARLHSPGAGLFAAASLGASPLFFRSVMIAQETGMTALGVAGMVWALVERGASSTWRDGLLAGLVGASAALAREYGPALLLCGFVAAVWLRSGWRAVAALAATPAALLLAWWLRNYVRCGNPFCSHDLGVFPVNPVFGGLMDWYRTVFGLGTLPPGDWLRLAAYLATEAGVALAVGLAASVLMRRRLGFLGAGAVMVMLLWCLSVGYTSGGLRYSLRVQAPALALLAIAAGCGLAELWVRMRPGVRQVTAGLVLLALGYGVWWAIGFPAERGMDRGLAVVSQVFDRSNSGVPEVDLPKLLRQAMPGGGRILGENARAHAVVATSGQRYEIVPVWSPEVAFLFDPELTPRQMRRRLVGEGIFAVLYYPESVNSEYLMSHSPFYAGDCDKWVVQARLGELCWLCLLTDD